VLEGTPIFPKVKGTWLKVMSAFYTSKLSDYAIESGSSKNPD
jgi:hypothetical protein